MRYVLVFWLVALLIPHAAWAQSIIQNLPTEAQDDNPDVVQIPPPVAKPPAPTAAATPAADTYTVTDVNADVTADSAPHARDQALMQAERAAFTQLCARLKIPDSAAKLNDDAIAALVQSFEVQSERLSAVRYIGVFTIRFKPAKIQKQFGRYVDASVDSGGNAAPGDDAKPAVTGPISHVQIAVATSSLAAWAQIKRRLNAVPQVARVDTIDLGRGLSHIDLSYGGAFEDLQNALTTQGFVLRQDATGSWNLIDGSMVPR